MHDYHRLGFGLAGALLGMLVMLAYVHYTLGTSAAAARPVPAQTQPNWDWIQPRPYQPSPDDQLRRSMGLPQPVHDLYGGLR